MHDPAQPSSLCELTDPGPGPLPALPPAANRLVQAVHDGTAPALLPQPTTPGPGRTAMPAGPLRGPADARTVAHALARPGFRPFLALLTHLDDWCAAVRPRHGDLFAPGVLDLCHDGLFGPLTAEAFTLCAATAAAGTADADRTAASRLAARGARHTAALDLFLERLRRDLHGPHWPADADLRGPVTAVDGFGLETHNGGQRVLRLRLAGGTAVAYKPRPATGELLFLTPEDSVFALLNAAPPASGPIRLPTLRCWAGDGTDPGYCWQEWIEPPPQQGVLRAEGEWRLTGTVLDRASADRFWQRAGELTAVCFGWGVADLSGSNVPVGVRPGAPEPLLYPVDLECFFVPVTRLADTGMLYEPGLDGHHHTALETEARWCDVEGDPLLWRRGADGALRLMPRRSAVGRLTTRSVVADETGEAGYAGHLPALLRGMFDAWTLLCRERRQLTAFFDERAPHHRVRVIARPTSDYYDPLLAEQGMPAEAVDPGPAHAPARTPDPEPLGADELRQLARLDVPYYFRSLAGGPVLAMAAQPGPYAAHPAEVHSASEPFWPPAPEFRQGTQLTLARLGVALRDAASQVFDQLTAAGPGTPDEPAHYAAHDERHGVRLRLASPGEGQVSFDWRSAGRRITYRWDARRTRLHIGPLTAPPPPPDPAPAGEIRLRLLRLDRVDAVLRNPWVASGFTDRELEARLLRLSATGLTWLRGVIDRYGWPGRSLVGSEAAGSACRLVQHAEGELEFRSHCLELIRQAAETSEMPWRDVAYVTDALLLAKGEPQWYGTKFIAGNEPGVLVPSPLREPDGVDARRAALGLEPLAEYAARVHRTFLPAGR